MKNYKKYSNRCIVPSYLFFYSKVFDSCEKASINFLYRDYDEVIANLYDCLEYFWKAISILASDNYPDTIHMPSRAHFESVTKQFLNRFLPKKEIYLIEQLFIDFNKDWNRNPIPRNEAKYGSKHNNHENTSPRFETVLATIPKHLSEIHRILITRERFSIGILNGFFSEDQKKEIQCDYYPWADFDGAKIDGWVNALNEFDTHLLSISEISPKFPLIINPFGETYPEITPHNNYLPGFRRIKNYISMGGVFLTASGNPFHYYFDVNTGNYFETEKSLQNIPTGFELVEIHNKEYQINVQQSTLIPTTLLQREFNVETTMKLSIEQSGAIKKMIYQDEYIKQIFDIKGFSQPVKLFRCIKPNQLSNITPILKSSLDGDECFPAALIHYGFGYLLHFGIALDSDSEIEFSLIHQILIDWIIKNYNKIFIKTEHHANNSLK